MGNQLKTVFFLGALTGLIMLIGGALGGRGGLYIAFIFATVMNFASYWFSDRIVLSLYRARRVEEFENPGLYNMVARLAQRASLPMPKLYIISTASPNAFATGRNPHNAAVAVTEGILQLLGENELEGVISHELAHVKNRDILISTIAATLAGVIMMLASMVRWAAIFGGFSRDDNDDGGGILSLIVLAIITPIAATLIQLAISRSREFLADEEGARIAGTPFGLARGLEKLAYGVERIPTSSNSATAHMFIVSPLSAKGMVKLFSTHPPIEERIKRLQSMRHS